MFELMKNTQKQMNWYSHFNVTPFYSNKDEECLYFPISPKSTLTASRTAYSSIFTSSSTKNNICHLLFIESGRQQTRATGFCGHMTTFTLFHKLETLLVPPSIFIYSPIINSWCGGIKVSSVNLGSCMEQPMTVRIWFINLLIAGRSWIM